MVVKTLRDRLASRARFSLVVLAACIVLVMLSFSLFARVAKQMFPLSERNQFLIYMNMPDGTDISRTETERWKSPRWLGDRTKIPR